MLRWDMLSLVFVKKKKIMCAKRSVVAQRSAATGTKGWPTIYHRRKVFRRWSVHDVADRVGVFIPRVEYDTCKGERDVKWCVTTNEGS